MGGGRWLLGDGRWVMGGGRWWTVGGFGETTTFALVLSTIKVVEVEGYLAFPLMVSETKELLVMLNQWDGCCIGVPPTPYDAIEVKLAEPAKRGGKHASFNFGGVRGTLKVDPYLVENWLVGLYVMDNAQMVEGAKPEL